MGNMLFTCSKRRRHFYGEKDDPVSVMKKEKGRDHNTVSATTSVYRTAQHRSANFPLKCGSTETHAEAESPIEVHIQACHPII